MKQSKIIGIPSGVKIEGGLSESNLVPLGSLSQINDDRYMNYAVKVFAKNFSRINDDTGSIKKCIKSLSTPKISYIKLRIIRPIITLIEDSLNMNKQFNNIAVSINFLSILGYNLDNVSVDIPQHIYKLQTENAIQIIGKLCAEGIGFDKTIESIANNQSIIQKVKSGFSFIEQLILNYEQPFSQFLTCLALNNDEFADWIIDYLLDASKNKIPLAKLLSEIIISQKIHNTNKVLSNKALQRVEKLYEYIIKQIEKYLEINTINNDTLKEVGGELTLSNIFPFIDALIAAIRISYPHPKYSLEEKYQNSKIMKLRLNIDIIQNLIQIYLKCIESGVEGFSKLSIKIIVSLIYLPAPFYCENQENIMKQSFNLIWDKLIKLKMYHLSGLMVALVYGGQEFKEQFIVNDAKNYKQLVNALISEISLANQDKSIIQTQRVKDLFSLLSSICSSKRIKKLITQSNNSSSNSSQVPVYIKIYSLIKHKKSDLFSGQNKNQNKLLFSWIDSDFLQLFVDFLKKISQNNNEVIQNIVTVLNQDIKELDQKRDELFVNEFLIPILQQSSTIPICFHAFDTLQRKWLINPIKVLNHPFYQAKFQQTNKNKGQRKIDKFNTKLLNQEQKQAFLKTLKNFTLDTGLYKKIKTYSWVKESTQDIDNQASLIGKLENNILNSPPYIIVIEGMNNGQKCLCGVFSSQTIQKSSIDQTYNISNGDDCFIFYYSENYQMHFRIEGNDFGQFNVQLDTSYLTFKYRELDRIYISFSDSNSSYVDINLFDMKPIENSQNIPHDIPNDFSFTKAEYWVLKPQKINIQEEKKNPLAMESMYDSMNSKNLLFQSEYFKQDSPYNYYRSPAVYHFPDELTLKQVILKINVPGLSISKEVLQKFTFNLRQTLKILSCDDNLTLKELQSQIDPNSNGIIDLEYNVDQFFLQSTPNNSNSIGLSAIQKSDEENLDKLQQPSQNQNLKILDCFIEQKGFKNIICVIKEQLLNWNNKSRAKKWLVYVQELNLFTILPQFFSEFMKKKEGVNTLFQLLAGIPDSGLNLNEKQEDTKVSQLKLPHMDYSEEYPIMKAFKKGQNNNDKSKEEEKEKNKYYEEQERKAVQNIYEVLSQVFNQDTKDHKIKNIAIENNLLQTIFERISQVSKEKSRKYIDKSHKEENNNEELIKQKIDSSIIQGVQKTVQSEKDEKSRSKHSKDNKKKGIGYASDNTGQNQKWNINEYVEIKKSRSELLISLMKILENFFKFSDWEVPQKIILIICESSLLPLLESAFRSGSLLEISKESSLILQYLKLVEVMSENEGLLQCLMKLDPHYQPAQTESIFDLLTNLRTTAEIFLNCLKPPANNIQDISFTQGLMFPTNDNKKAHEFSASFQLPHEMKSTQTDTQNDIQVSEQEENNVLSQQIAARIISVHEKIEKAINLYNEHQYQVISKNSQNNIDLEIDEEQSQSKRLMQVLELPLDIKYKILLEKLRFGYFSMIDLNNLNSIQQNQNPSQIKMVRLAQEVADMANSLPVDYTNSMFVRCDSKRVDVMKCIIMGSTGTPYANGAFLYDVFFEDNYPNCSPKVNLQTTGNGKVRFNPNLYQCGKVCLSLLGTWKGQASENWDPKISTLLQVLVSLQAIIMNDDIYFNEPGYEGHSGTDDGEKKNEGYSNIVRYCNVKYAMIDSIRNPPEGFAEIIKRHFYLKKDEILSECEGWIDRSYKKPASYIGLVNDHNPLLCQEFKQQNRYSEMLTKAVQDLRQELEKLTPPTSVDTQEEIAKKKARKLEQMNRQKLNLQNQGKQQQDKSQNTKKGGMIQNALVDQDMIDNKIDQNMINMGEDIDIEREDVKDRWSRYICAMGIDAVAKQSKCSIFLSGLGPLGVEIAKNIVLSGVKRITLHDTQNVCLKDLCGQFFLKEEHIGKNRAEATLLDISQLNHYVRVDKNTIPLSTNTSDLIEKLSLNEYNVIILADTFTLDIQYAINSFCRERSIKFIASQVQGPFACLFNDFGDNFEVIDKNGEDPLEVVISKIEPQIIDSPENKKKTKVTLLPGQKHIYEDGERIIITQVKGMKLLKDENKSINDTIHKIEVINTNSFYLLSDCSDYTPYEGSGIAKNIKTPVNLTFNSLKHCIQTNNLSMFDQSLQYHDFEKCDIIPYIHLAFLALYDFITVNQRYPYPWDIQDCTSFIQIAKSHYDAFDLPQKNDEKMQQKFKQYITKFSFTVSGTFPPLCAFMGGFISQEAIKAITNKYIPTKQFFYTDCIEVISDMNWDNIDDSNERIRHLQTLSKQSLNQNTQLQLVIGEEMFEKLLHTKLFMVGSGAIGCELLKNFAMISLCTGEENKDRHLKQGLLTLTDPDHIENSNLNRQFLFREDHIRKPKSSTAAAAAIKINPRLKNHIIACLDKVCEGTKNIFTDSFFEDQDIVANALDNLEARRYVDKRCVSSKIPLLESGTLGPKGHVQVIIPFKTESYGSQQDPQEEGGDIPHCTLKMFPEEPLHCVEWARDKFGKQVTLKPKVVLKILDEIEQLKSGTIQSDIKNLRESLKFLKNRPISFEDCIEFAVQKFYKYYRNNIRQLLHTYPLDQKIKDGTDFWKLPKRAPKEISKLDQENPLHRDFISIMSVMRAKTFNIPYPQNFRQIEEKNSIMQIAIKISVLDFQPSEQKSNEIAAQVKEKEGEQTIQSENNSIKENNQIIDKQQGVQQFYDDEDANSLIIKIEEMKNQIQKNNFIQPEEFEKDVDSNGHIDFIYSLANLRSVNYQLPNMDWLTVKLKAGKIVPALATTTAAIAGLQTIELVKTLKNIHLSQIKNAFLNLAVPSLQLTEPAPPPQFKITEKIKVNIWDRWEIKLDRNENLSQLFKYFESERELKIFNILIGTDLLYAQTMAQDDKQSILESTFIEIINNNTIIETDSKYLDLNILFTEINNFQILSNTPAVRVLFNSNEDVVKQQ